MKAFQDRQEVENLTKEQAFEVIVEARDRLVVVSTPFTGLDGQIHQQAYGLDDQGDYLYAAITNYNRLFLADWEDDGTSTVEKVRAFLLEPEEDWLGSDGEIRFDLCPWAVE